MSSITRLSTNTRYLSGAFTGGSQPMVTVRVGRQAIVIVAIAINNACLIDTVSAAPPACDLQRYRSNGSQPDNPTRIP